MIAFISQSPGMAKEYIEYSLGVIVGIAIVPALFSFYVFYYFLFPRYLQRRKVLEAFVAGLIVSLISFLVAALTLRFTAGMGWSCYGISNYIAIPIVAFISFLQGGAAFIIRGFITWFDELKVKEELLRKNHEMELALVKSQLDPHFLFNTLNNIDILMVKDTEKASVYLNKLSDIMRFILFETKTTMIPLTREIEYIQKYVELQRIRTSNPTYVSFDVVGPVEGKVVAPLVFIPFIENAFKHANNKKLENTIEIKITTTDSSISMRCDNKIDQGRAPNVESNGLGNNLISKRLQLLYPDQHELHVFKKEDQYSVVLKLFYEST